jgi:hypothetical protein
MSAIRKSTHRGAIWLILWILSLVFFFVFGPFIFSKGKSNPFRRRHIYERVCPETGKNSAAPLNFQDLSISIPRAVNKIQLHRKNAVIISTTANKEAANYNLPYLFESLASLKPPLINSTIVFCLDKWSCEKCKSLHVDSELCIYMDLGISSESLAPVSGGKDFKARSYWRLTYGRVYATLKIHNEGVSVLPIDADALFFKNPFTSEEVLQFPDKIAGVIDDQPVDLSNNTQSTFLNGGLLYFPATTTKSAILTNNVLKDIWKQSCIEQNEQLVTTGVIRNLSRSLPLDDPYMPRILNVDKYLNFCSNPCGSLDFREITSLNHLHLLEGKMKGKPEFKLCTKAYRKDWVYFHAACTKWPDGKSIDLSKAKGDVQRAIIAWVKESKLS